MFYFKNINSKPCVKPIVPNGGWLNTTVGIFSYDKQLSTSPLKIRWAKRRPAATATISFYHNKHHIFCFSLFIKIFFIMY